MAIGALRIVLGNPCFKSLFLSTLAVYYIEVLKPTIHPNRVLPIVGALGIFASVLDACCLVGFHCFLPDSLLDATHLNTGRVFVIYHIFYPPRSEITVCASGEADSHSIVTFAISIEGNRCIRNRLVGLVVLAVKCRIVASISIHTEDAEVARMACPHPVVGITTELAHRAGRSHYETHVLEYIVHNYIVLVACIVGSYLTHNSRPLGILCIDFLAQLFDDLHTLHFALSTFYGSFDTRSYVYDFTEIANAKPRDREFFSVIIRTETITEVVMIYRTLALDSTKTTVMIGEDKTFVRYRNTGTAPTKNYDCTCHTGLTKAIELLWRQLKAQLLHAFVVLLIELIE